MNCEECKYAEWDYEEYYGTTKKQWFVCGCKADCDPEDCDEFERREENEQKL